MNLAPALDAMIPAVENVCAELGIPTEARLEDLLRAQMRGQRAQRETVDAEVNAADLSRLYELRARHLDWIYETGYLGFFARNAGTRYTFRRGLEEKMALLERCAPGDLLEIGCGAGILSVLAGRRPGQVVGTDISPTAIAFARRFAQRVDAGNVRFTVADAERLPFPDGAFATVVCGEVIAHVSSPSRAAAEIGRVTARGGSVLLSTPCALSPTRGALRLAALVRPGVTLHAERRVDHRVADILREGGKQVSDGELLRLKRHFRYGEVVALMRDAGMRVCEVRGATLDLPPAALIYSRIPAGVLRALRGVESLLNRLGVFGRVLSISTIFRFEKVL